MKMKRIALLSCQDLTNFVCDDGLLIEPLAELGFKADFVSWDEPNADWKTYDIAIIRATWDYTQRLDEFLEALNRIEASGCRLYNSLPVTKWNARKTYLLDLERQGVEIVPTKILESFESSAQCLDFFDFWQTPEIVVKPTVSASAHSTFRIQRKALGEVESAMVKALQKSEVMVQPFIQSIVEKGEVSLHFMNGEFSHAIRKLPKPGDFRVQEEHGGTITSFTPSEDLKWTARKVMEALPEPCLYGRIDLVEGTKEGKWLLMEAELIEPSLYLRTDPQAPRRFAQAVDDFTARPPTRKSRSKQHPQELSKKVTE